MKKKFFLISIVGLLGLTGCQSAQPVTDAESSTTSQRLEDRSATEASNHGQTPVTLSKKKSTTVTETDPSVAEKQPLGMPYETEMDERSEAALRFIREKDPELGAVSRYRKQIVKGTKYYFEFFQYGALAYEIVVYEDLDGKLEIVSKKSLK